MISPVPSLAPRWPIRLFILLLALCSLPLIVSMLVLWKMHEFNPDFLKIDACMDAGGRWNDETKCCEGAR
jgi:hypothetical protein